ncbi:hypothetical protein [Streptomyces sp. NPDC093707]|uniref:hypothetical protein n=1 Tax=Streptomyces sp. NPDC093707 TaxID=3154984 RepID=UPI00344E6345
MIDRARVTEALRAMLATATGKPCGLGQLPFFGGKSAPLPYTALYPQGGPVGGAPLADRAEDARLVCQVTVVATRTDQAEWLADRVRQAMLGRTSTGGWVSPILVPGVYVWARELLTDGGVTPEESGSHVVTGVHRYELSITV